MRKQYHVTKGLEIEAPASICYGVMCDITSYPSWFKHIREIIIKDTYDDGRASSAFYLFDIVFKKNIKVLWSYQYDDEQYRLLCRSIGGDFTDTEAVYEFRSLLTGKTLFNFIVTVDFGLVLPAKIINFLIDVVMKDFLVMIKRECERRASLPG
jgi:uncharacterized membrane protein